MSMFVFAINIFYFYKKLHVFITGGSSGLGLELAKQYSRLGAYVTIMARNIDRLNNAVEQIKKESSEKQENKICGLSGDVTSFKDCISIVEECKERCTSYSKPNINLLICSAGSSIPGYFAEQSIDVFRKQMDLNYFGSLNMVKALLPELIANENAEPSTFQNHIVFVGSVMSLMGMIGYSQYAASKQALRGLADSLRNELLRYNIRTSIFYPSTINTPGFEKENLTKPSETKIIEGSATCFSAKEAALQLIKGLESGSYAITQEFLIQLLRSSMNGINPRSSAMFPHHFLNGLSIFLELILSPIGQLVQSGYRIWIDQVVVSSNRKNRISKLD